VTVTWIVTDPESAIVSTTGCEETILDYETMGTDLTCSATSAGGTHQESVTIKIDMTPPELIITVPAVYDVSPLGTALDFSASDALSGLVADALATLTSQESQQTMQSGQLPGVGVYLVVIEASDLAGNVAISDERLLVIYDPTAGFITGGGWIDSPEGAYKSDLSMTGKATFGFVAKYDKKTNSPEGNTQFVFNAGDIHFHSSDYDWFVVNSNESRAQFKGTGAINEEGGFKFMLWGTDGDPDTFRIKIWSEDQYGLETVIYDNSTEQALGGGSIVVHTK
jgi:hypothetical protein